MALESSQKAWGYYCTATGGTGTTLVTIIPKGTNVNNFIGVCGYGTAATTICAIADADGNQVTRFVPSSTPCVYLGGPITLDGLSAYITGAGAATSGNAFLSILLKNS